MRFRSALLGSVSAAAIVAALPRQFYWILDRDPYPLDGPYWPMALAA